MANITDGNRFEAEFCRKLGNAGFWVHRLSQNRGGQQPADVIAMKSGGTWLIDCKVCKDGRFRLDRMEDNQRSAMDKWLECGGTAPKFALEDGTTGQIWMLDYQWAAAKEESGMVSVPCIAYQSFVVSLEDWIEWVAG